jgi:membrane protein implicated in regulation of membrane protease activity
MEDRKMGSVIGRTGIVTREIFPNSLGEVRVGEELKFATSSNHFPCGSEVKVKEVEKGRSFPILVVEQSC